MRATMLPPFVLIAIPALLAAQSPVAYDVRLANAVHHEAEITVTFRDVPRGTLEARMSRSSPGRYALHEFAKNVYAVRAEDSRGIPLVVVQANPHQWDIAGHDGTVRITYTLFADRADGTYSGIDLTHAHLNIPATFMWARGFDARPVEVRFHNLPSGWRVATQLVPSADSAVWRGRDFQYFMDSPIEVSAFEFRSWPVTSAAGPASVRLAIHHDGTAEEVDRYVEMIKKVVAEQGAIYGELAPYDFGTYTFLADYVPHASGDGMEHRNSTVISSSGSLRANMTGLLGTVAHEFFHSWNVERIRPKTLEPFDFERENMSGELWLAEGFTSYYGPLTIRRAGLSDDRQFARGLSGTVNAVLNAPGRRFYGPSGMSRQAPFVDAASSIDPQNTANTFLSYYTYGNGIAIALDLTLRQRYPGVTLDSFMREMWTRHGKTEKSYTPADFRAALGAVTHDTAFANDFYRRYVDAAQAPDYAALLALAGMLVRKTQFGIAWMTDTHWRADDGKVSLDGPTLIGTPLYEAGLDRGDILTRLGGDPVTTTADIDRIIGSKKPGDVLPITWISRGVTRQGMVTLGESPRVEVVMYEEAGMEVTDAMRRFRAAWLSTKVRP